VVAFTRGIPRIPRYFAVADITLELPRLRACLLKAEPNNSGCKVNQPARLGASIRPQSTSGSSRFSTLKIHCSIVAPPARLTNSRVALSR
jgi:hypothetical protein